MAPRVDPPAKPRIVRCPACGGDSVYAPTNPYRPFCSERCKNLDFGAWASESFRVPDEAQSCYLVRTPEGEWGVEIQILDPAVLTRVEARRVEAVQRREARGHRERVPGERARLVDVAARREPLHHVGAAAEGAHRHAAADHLAERGEVGGDAGELARPARRHPEAGHHLVEDQQRARLVGEVAQALQEARLR